ncbi:MAG: HAMP domain-containing sensor histidine kinase [Eubacteriales bacterium]
MNRRFLKKIYTGQIAVIVLLLALFFLFNFVGHDEFNPINQLRIDCNDIYQEIQSNWNGLNQDYSYISAKAEKDMIYVTIIDMEENILFTNSTTIDTENKEMLKEALYMDNAYILENDSMYKIAQPIYYEKSVAGFVIFEKSYIYKDDKANIKNILLCLIFVCAVLLIVLLGYVIFKNQTTEISELIKALDDITKGKYKPLKLTKNEEYSQLYHAYNMMAEEIKYRMDKKEYNEHQRKLFINQISHELKTPISTINAYVEGLQNNLASDEEKRQNYIEIIHTKMNQLTELINDFFAYAQEDAQHFKYNFEECYANTVMDDIFSGIKENGERNVVCTNLLPKCIVNIDKVRLEQVVLNLYNNAVKHTNTEDRIEISSYREDDNVVIEVSDSGTGIPVNELPYIFDSYYQGSKSKRMDYQGAGLGLSICKSIIDAHKGSMKVKSQMGKGTTMYVYIPMV